MAFGLTTNDIVTMTENGENHTNADPGTTEASNEDNAFELQSMQRWLTPGTRRGLPVVPAAQGKNVVKLSETFTPQKKAHCRALTPEEQNQIVRGTVQHLRLHTLDDWHSQGIMARAIIGAERGTDAE